ncbi:8-oxoguanine glycosylase ogg1 [Actinomortierella ambigua]|nr:8-oxoguanine glycosylase ogg1 [Actinomortierella ambigua]
MTLLAKESGNDAEAVDSKARSDITSSVPARNDQGSSVTKALKRTLSYKEEEDDETNVHQGTEEGETVPKKLKQEEEEERVVTQSSGGEHQNDEESKEGEEEELDYEAQRRRNILENQRILAELGLDNGIAAGVFQSFPPRTPNSRPPSSSMHGHRGRTRPGRSVEAGSDDEFVDQEEEDMDGRGGRRRNTGSSTKLKLLKDAQPVQLRQSLRLRGYKAPETKGVLSDDTDGDEDLTDGSDNETKKGRKSRRKAYEDKQWKTRNNGVQDILPSEQKLVARSAWKGRKQLTGFMIELELPDNISAPLTLRKFFSCVRKLVTLATIATTIWDIGKIYDGKTNKLSYWSGNGSLYKHPYPIGFKAEKQYFRNTFAMEIQATDSGPEFIVRNMDNGQTFRGPNPLLQKMIEKLDGYQRWSAVCAEIEREKLGLAPLPTPALAETSPDSAKARPEEEDTKDEKDVSPQPQPTQDNNPDDGIMGDRVFLLQQTDDGIRYKTLKWTTSQQSINTKSDGISKKFGQPIADDEAFLRDYFQLQVPLTKLYIEWSEKDSHFRKKAPFYPGIRILRQDPVENLICFICSSNNNISRISQMALKLSQEYGKAVSISAEDRVGDLAHIPETYYTFPDLDSLAQDGVESRLRELGFGYRAKYIAKTADMIQQMEDGLGWLYGLRSVSHEEAREALTSLQGVGPKVADCVCLMSLDKNAAIPVDTHVWQIAIRDYHFRTGNKIPKSMTPSIYKAVGDLFNGLFGQYSGWAHSVLFAADLRSMQGRENDADGIIATTTTTSTATTTAIVAVSSGTTTKATSIKKVKTVKVKTETIDQSKEPVNKVASPSSDDISSSRSERRSKRVAAKVEVKTEETLIESTTLLSRPRRSAQKRQKVERDGSKSKYFEN